MWAALFPRSGQEFPLWLSQREYAELYAELSNKFRWALSTSVDGKLPWGYPEKQDLASILASDALVAAKARSESSHALTRREFREAVTSRDREWVDAYQAAD